MTTPAPPSGTESGPRPAARRPPTARVRWRRAFPALRHRNFRLFLAGQFVSLCGTWMQTVAHGWLVLTLTDSPFLVGLVPAVGSLPILLFTLYGGVVADRVDKHRFIVVLQCLMLLEALTLATLTWLGIVTVPWVLALATFFGLLTAFEVPARQAFVSEMVGRGDLVNAIALNSTAYNLSRVFGPALAGALIAFAGLSAAFFANALSYVGVLVGLVLMRWPEGQRPQPRAGAAASFGEGFRHLAREPWPRALILLTAAFALFGFPFITMLSVFARDALGIGASGFGILVSAVGVGAAAGAIVLAAAGSRVSQAPLALRCALIFGVLLGVVALMPGWVPAALLLTGVGCAMAVQGISANAYLQRTAPDHLRGRVMGFYSFVALGMAPFGALLAGAVAERFGVRASLAMGGLACALTGIGLALAMRGIPDSYLPPSTR